MMILGCLAKPSVSTIQQTSIGPDEVTSRLLLGCGAVVGPGLEPQRLDSDNRVQGMSRK